MASPAGQSDGASGTADPSPVPTAAVPGAVEADAGRAADAGDGGGVPVVPTPAAAPGSSAADGEGVTPPDAILSALRASQAASDEAAAPPDATAASAATDVTVAAAADAAAPEAGAAAPATSSAGGNAEADTTGVAVVAPVAPREAPRGGPVVSAPVPAAEPAPAPHATEVIAPPPPPATTTQPSVPGSQAGSGRELDALVRALARVEQHGDVDVDASAREAVTRHVRTLLSLRLGHLAAVLPTLHGPSGLWAAMDALMLAEPTSQV